MRHVDRPVALCRRHIPLFVLLFTLSLSFPAAAQVAIGVGYAWQRLSIGPFAFDMRGTAVDLSIRAGRRIDVLIGVETGTFAADPLTPDKKLWTLRTGVHARLLRSRVVNLGLVVGGGIYGADMDSEDLDSEGLSGFVQGRVTVHPVPAVGIYAGGTVQALGGIGTAPGGSTTGVTLGIQVQTPGW